MGLFGKKKKDPRERRRVYRIPEKNAMLVVNDVSYPVTDWSIDGFGAQGYRGGFNDGDTARARLIILHRGKPVGFDAKAKIVRADPENRILAGQFTSMSSSARQEIAKVYRERLAMYQTEVSGTDDIDQIDAEAISRALRSRGLGQH